MNQITLHDLNRPDVRVMVRDAPTVVFVNPHTGWKFVAAGGAAVETARQSGAEGVFGLYLSIEDEGFEYELGAGCAARDPWRRGADGRGEAPPAREHDSEILEPRARRAVE